MLHHEGNTLSPKLLTVYQSLGKGGASGAPPLLHDGKLVGLLCVITGAELPRGKNQATPGGRHSTTDVI